MSTTLTGSFTAPGVSGAVTASGPVTVTLTGQVSNGFVTLEQSVDGINWTTYFAWDRVLAPVFGPAAIGPNPHDVGTGPTDTPHGRPTDPPPISMTWPNAGPGFPVIGYRYRLRCVQFDSGSLSWRLTA